MFFHGEIVHQDDAKDLDAGDSRDSQQFRYQRPLVTIRFVEDYLLRFISIEFEIVHNRPVLNMLELSIPAVQVGGRNDEVEIVSELHKSFANSNCEPTLDLY